MRTITLWLVLALALFAAFGGIRTLNAAPLRGGDGLNQFQQLAELPTWAQRAVDPDPAISALAIGQLRAAGPAGITAMEMAHESALRMAFSKPEQKQTAEWQRLITAFEKVGAQRDNWASRLYWFTDLEAAKVEAKKQSKPILSLRLLGNLDDELSCANSRFFRTALYPNGRIRQFLGEHYILHWKSVRSVPKVTIDFGDGRKIETTITGNSVHYMLDSEGRVLDALPGLYAPGVFFKWIERIQNLNDELNQTPHPQRSESLKNFHNERLQQITREWQTDVGRVRLADQSTLIGPVQAATLQNLQQRAQAVQRPASNAIAKASAAPAPSTSQLQPDEMIVAIRPTARNAAPIALTKRVLEMPTLKAISVPVPRDRDALARKTDDALWEKIAGLHLRDAKLDNASLEVLQSKTPRAKIVAAAFENAIAEDSVRNEYTRHALIHQRLAENPNVDLEALNRRVYAEMFLTPDSDPWLGLLPAETYTAIANDGISGPKLQNIAMTDDDDVAPNAAKPAVTPAGSTPTQPAAKTRGGFQVGDKVEAWNIAWYKATILEVGSGEYAGYYKVHYSDFSSASDQWLKASSVRAPSATAKAENKKAVGSSAQPRLGKYLIYSYGSAKYPLFLGHFELMSGGRYRVSRSSSGNYYGDGKYSFDAKTKSIKWLSGQYVKDKWGGDFSVSREGKTHNIRLSRSTNASNSIDSK